jgi:hypothetical protein
VLAPDRDVPLHFLRAGDQRTVATSTIVDGVRQDVLSADGQRALDEAVAIGTDLPPAVRAVDVGEHGAGEGGIAVLVSSSSGAACGSPPTRGRAAAASTAPRRPTCRAPIAPIASGRRRG